MSKSILYRLFRVGRIPGAKKQPLVAEGILLMDEGIHGSIKFKTFKADGRRYYHTVSWFTGAVVLTGNRFAAYASSKAFINLPMEDERFDRIRIPESSDEILVLVFNAADFGQGGSGEVECRFCTPKAQQFKMALTSGREDGNCSGAGRNDK